MGKTIKHVVTRALAAVGLSIYARELYNRLKLLLNADLRSRNHRIYENPPDGLPLPPLKLIYLVTGRFDADHFYNSGLGMPDYLKGTLEKAGASIESSGPILDFGCGCGRSIRHLKGMARLGLHGSDYNPALIDWCRSNLGFAEFRVNGLASRTSYDDMQFGLVYAISVFTHFDEDLQEFWMREMARIIRPGGFLMATTHGEEYLGHFTEAERSGFLSGRLVVLSAGAQGKNECAAYHPRQYMEKLVYGLFEPVVHLPGNGWQDTWLLKRL